MNTYILPTGRLSTALASAIAAVLAAPTGHAGTYAWDSSNVTGPPATPLDWSSGGPHTPGGGSPATSGTGAPALSGENAFITFTIPQYAAPKKFARLSVAQTP